MRRVVTEKFRTIEPPLPLPKLKSLHDFHAFDDAVTAPLNGFASADDYYAQASSGPFLRSIVVPTLIMQARDDPFMGHNNLPSAQDLAPAIRFELSARGGHVGFVASGRLGQPVYWLESRIPTWLALNLPAFATRSHQAVAAKPAR